MLSIIILEDELLQQSRIENVIQELIAQKSLQCKPPKIFGKPHQLVEAITERGSHQLFFLDIEIKEEEKKGLDIAKEIRKKDPNATIVFVTTHSEFMPITFKYKVAALDFIDKNLPDIEYEDRIISDIGLALSKNGLSQIECAFTIDTKNATIQVPFHKILYFETSPTVHKVILHTTEEQIEFYGQLSKIVKQDCRLYKCHKSFVVNPENIVRLDKELGVIYFENGESCLVSKAKQKEIVAKMLVPKNMAV